jgi:phage/plasmid primase-like uncharacterized protein
MNKNIYNHLGPLVADFSLFDWIACEGYATAAGIRADTGDLTEAARLIGVNTWLVARGK